MARGNMARGNIAQDRNAGGRSRYATIARYTLRSSSDPRGRLRGGAACGFGEAVTADLGGGGMIGAATGGVARTRACRILAGPADAGAWPGAAAGAGLTPGDVAFAIPMNVAGDNMMLTLTHHR
jgi:hypothetical protein